MAEINLLKTSTPTTSLWENLSGWLVKILALLVILVIGYYVFLFFKVKSLNKQITDVQDNIQSAKAAALSMPGREEFLTRQAQVKEFATLTGAHVYYSKLLPALAKVTLKSAYYTNLSLTTQGKVSLQVVVPSLEDLDKYLQVFDQPDVVKNFFNVHMSGFSKTQDSSGKVYVFNVQMDFNPGILSAAADSN